MSHLCGEDRCVNPEHVHLSKEDLLFIPQYWCLCAGGTLPLPPRRTEPPEGHEPDATERVKAAVTNAALFMQRAGLSSNERLCPVLCSWSFTRGVGLHANGMAVTRCRALRRRHSPDLPGSWGLKKPKPMAATLP